MRSSAPDDNFTGSASDISHYSVVENYFLSVNI